MRASNKQKKQLAEISLLDMMPLSLLISEIGICIEVAQSDTKVHQEDCQGGQGFFGEASGSSMSTSLLVRAIASKSEVRFFLSSWGSHVLVIDHDRPHRFHAFASAHSGRTVLLRCERCDTEV